VISRASTPGHSEIGFALSPRPERQARSGSFIRASIVSLVLLTAIPCVAYPLVVTGVALVAFPNQANGSLIVKDGKVVGSRLLGQSFDDPKYFWGRLSATSPVPYPAFNADKGTGSTGSNLGPLNPALFDAVKGRIRALRDAGKAAGVESGGPVPADPVTASASGLDPDISPAAADYQAARVAKVRGVAGRRPHRGAHGEGRQLLLLGEPRVNVLELNLALDAPSPWAPSPRPQAEQLPRPPPRSHRRQPTSKAGLSWRDRALPRRREGGRGRAGRAFR
jgi:K+-transporting ATPase ATPase C chain